MPQSERTIRSLKPPKAGSKIIALRLRKPSRMQAVAPSTAARYFEDVEQAPQPSSPTASPLPSRAGGFRVSSPDG